MKTCERCGDAIAERGSRFCKDCVKAVKAELRNSGYLTPAPRCVGQWSGAGRPAEARENTNETKHGTGH